METEPRPLRRRGLAERSAAFAGILALAFATVALPPSHNESVVLLSMAAGLSVAILAAGFLVPWSRLPSWTESLPPLAAFAVVALLRHADGGGNSGFGMLVLLPITWLALWGTRRQLWVATGLVAAVFIGPILVLGAPDYPVTQWRSAILWLVVAPGLGFTIQALMTKSRSHARIQRLVAEAVRSLSSGADARQDVCQAMATISQACMTMLFEPDGKGSLVCTASAGKKLSTVKRAIGKEPSAAVVAYTSRGPVFVSHVAGHPAVSKRLHKTSGAVSALFEPVLRGDEPVGVFGVFWARKVKGVSDDAAAAVSLLAHEAGIAIERADMLVRLESLARTDSLTGLPNRRVWDEELPRELARAARSRKPVTVVMLDLDRFKQFNDSNGHQAGDRLLKETAAAWEGELRNVDLIVRYGGEEFAALLHDCSLEDAERLVSDLRAVTPGEVTCSAGIACWDRTEKAAELVNRADQALYAAKRAGRDRLVLA